MALAPKTDVPQTPVAASKTQPEENQEVSGALHDLFDSDSPINERQTWAYFALTIGSFILFGLASAAVLLRFF